MSEGNGTANATGSAYPEMPADYSPRFAPNFESMNDAQLRHLVVNIQSRQDWLINALSDKSRNLYSACRVDEPHTVTPQKYMEMFQYNPVGGRVVEVLPKESWQVCPCVYEKESGKATTPFEKDWKALSKQLLSNGIPSHYNDDDATAIWEPLTRADIMSGIGQFGLVLLGLADGAADLLQPAKPRKGQKLNFLQVYSDYECKISKYDTDPTSPRYGRPLSYQVTSAAATLEDRFESTSGVLPPNSTSEIHWTRVIHVADIHHQPSSIDFLAVPRQRPVWYPLEGLMKLLLSSPEMYWKGAFAGIALKTQSQAAEIPVDKAAVRQMMWKYENDLQRWIALQNMDATSLPTQVVDPSPQIDKMIETICIKMGMPVRIFKGSERGELASNQDDKAWNDRLSERQDNYITPRIVIPFVDRLIYLGVLSEPADGYKVEWPDLTSKSDQEKAQAALTITQGLTAYSTGGLQQYITPLDYWTLVQQFDMEEAKSIVDNADKANAQAQAEEQAQAVVSQQVDANGNPIGPDASQPNPSQQGSVGSSQGSAAASDAAASGQLGGK